MEMPEEVLMLEEEVVATSRRRDSRGSGIRGCRVDNSAPGEAGSGSAAGRDSTGCWRQLLAAGEREKCMISPLTMAGLRWLVWRSRLVLLPDRAQRQAAGSAPGVAGLARGCPDSDSDSGSRPDPGPSPGPGLSPAAANNPVPSPSSGDLFWWTVGPRRRPQQILAHRRRMRLAPLGLPETCARGGLGCRYHCLCLVGLGVGHALWR